MFMKLYDDGGPAEDVYAATVLNDHGLWDGCELLHLPTRVVVRSTSERSAFLNQKRAEAMLAEQLIARGVLIHG